MPPTTAGRMDDRQPSHGLPFRHHPEPGEHDHTYIDQRHDPRGDAGTCLQPHAAMNKDPQNRRLTGSTPSWMDDREWRRFSTRIEEHLKKADFVPVDVSRFTQSQIARIEEFIADRELSPRVFLVGRSWRL